MNVFLNFIKISLVFAISVNCVASANAQQPGGVSGTKLWYETKKQAGSFFLVDISGHSYPGYGSSSVRNVNFHPALRMVDLDLNFNNFSFNQGTVAGAYYPDGSKQNEKDFFWLDYLDDSVSLRSSLVGLTRRQFRYGNSSKRSTLEVAQTGVTTLENAMKTAVYMRGTKKTYYSIWGEDKLTTFNSDFPGYLPELIIYNRILDPIERAKVETYLAIKYGATLDSSYTGSNGKSLWDINDKIIKTFHHRVCAIGRDLPAAIRQPKSNTSYEESFDNFTAFNKDADDSTIDSRWKLIPRGEGPSLYRSLTIGFCDTTMRSIQDGRFIFLGDDAASVASAEFKDRFKTQYPKMKSVKREWIIQNKDALREPIKIVVAGGDYGASTLFNTLYDPYDYQLFRFVLIKTNQSADQLLGKPVLCDYFIREQSRTSVEFNTRAIVWDSLSLNESPNTFFSFGKVDILNFLSITSLFDKKTRILEYPYYEDSAIRAATYFDTTAVRFNYVREDSVLKFSFKTSIGVGALQVRLFVTDAIGKRKLLPASYIINPTGVTDTSKGSVPMAQREDADIKILEATEDDNPSNIPGSSRTPIKYIVRRKRPELQKFKEFKVAIPLQKPLDIQSRFLIEITDAIGQITTLPVRIKSRP